MLTKSEYLLFLKSPMHMWATAHKLLEKSGVSEFDQIKRKQGYEVEEYAKQYFQTILLPKYPNAELLWQQTYTNDEYKCRADALIYDKNHQVYDVYEIKSSTDVDHENERDLTFQTLIYDNNFSVRNVHILHLNKEYVRDGEINIEKLFVIKNLNDVVNNLKVKVLNERREALRIIKLDNSKLIEACTIPDKCPCLKLCHPNLPPYSIYDLMNKNKKKMLELRSLGVTKLVDIPDDFHLNDKQLNQIEAVKINTPYVNHAAIAVELNKLIYPLYFLDYETFGSAIPQYDGYKPQQNIVFQYSLHKVSEDGKVEHYEHLSIVKEDPSISLLLKLETILGPVGTVISWNKSFESGRNNEMAKRYPQFTVFLEGVNRRIYDLADSVKAGYLIHPEFHGSWSIKLVLPALVPRLSYTEMSICKGDQAMASWWRLIHELPQNGEEEPEWLSETNSTKSNMLKYCELDTLAMVEIWKSFKLFTDFIN